MDDLTLQLLFFRLAALLIIAAVHGATLAVAARLLGDPGPQYDGRLTLNPISQLDAVGSVGVVVFQMGWIKPLAIDPAKLRGGRIALIVVALAGLAATVVLAVVLQLLRLPALNLIEGNFGLSAAAFLNLAAVTALWFTVFNVMPLPPLTGGLFLRAFAPQADKLPETLHWAIIAGLALFVVTGIAERVLAPVVSAVAGMVLST